MIKKVSRHIVQNELLIFEHSSPGKSGYQLPELDVPDVDAEAVLGAAERTRRNRRFSRKSAKSKPSGISRASRPGTTPSTLVCIRSAPAP